MEKVLKGLFSQYHSEAEKANLHLRCSSCKPQDGCVLYSDEERLTQVLSNLIHNALKFTSEGFIEFGCQAEDRDILFFVMDTGKGIQENGVDIFDRFVQENNALAREYEGAGLGLSISKGLVELLGGKIWFEAREGNGSVFKFRLPLSRDEAETGFPMDRQNGQRQPAGKTLILVAEDDMISSLYLKKLLQDQGYAVQHANDGETAIDLVRENPSVKLVLMDIKMPGKDGIAATREIRSIQPDLPVIAQTAYGQKDEIDAILEAGCNDYLFKPIAKEKLFQMLGKYL